MLELANDDLITGLLPKQELSSIFYFLWNSYSLFITVKDKRHFNHWLNPGIKDGIFKMIQKNKDLHYLKPKYEHLLMLVGLLAYLDIQPSRLRSILSPLYIAPLFGWHGGKAGFSPRLFFSSGCGVFPGEESIFSILGNSEGKEGSVQNANRGSAGIVKSRVKSNKVELIFVFYEIPSAWGNVTKGFKIFNLFSIEWLWCKSSEYKILASTLRAEAMIKLSQ